jgi:hypothetical protein
MQRTTNKEGKMGAVGSLANLGIFFFGVGFLMLGCGLFWWVSLYDKFHKEKQEKDK